MFEAEIREQLTTYAQLLLQALLAARASFVRSGSPTVYDRIFALWAELLCSRDELANYFGRETLLDLPALQCQAFLHRALARPVAPAVSLSNLEKLLTYVNPDLLPAVVVECVRWSPTLDQYLHLCGWMLGSSASEETWQRRLPIRSGGESRARWLRYAQPAPGRWCLADDLKLYGALRRGARGGWQGAWVSLDGGVAADEIVLRWKLILRANFRKPKTEILDDWEIDDQIITFRAG